MLNVGDIVIFTGGICEGHRALITGVDLEDAILTYKVAIKQNGNNRSFWCERKDIEKIVNCIFYNDV